MALMIVELGRWEIASEIRRQFPEEKVIEVLQRRGEIDVPTEAKSLKKEFATKISKLKSAGENPIRVFLSGPVALSFIFGMYVGLTHFDLEIYHYESDRKGEKYLLVSSPVQK